MPYNFATQIPQQKNTAVDYLLAGQQKAAEGLAKQRNSAALKMQELQFQEKLQHQEFVARAFSAMEGPEDVTDTINAIASVLGPQTLPQVQERMGKFTQGLDSDPEIAKLQFKKRQKVISAAMWDEVERNSAESNRLRGEELEKPVIASAGAQMVSRKKGEEGKVLHTVPQQPKDKKFDLFNDPEGNPVYIEKGSEVPKGYTPLKSSGVTVNVGDAKPAPSSERESLNKLLEFKNSLNIIKKDWQPGYTGRFDGLLGAGKELTGIKADAKESMYRRVVKDIQDTLLRLRSGAQINEQEYARLSKIVPTINLPDKVFLARLDSLEQAMDSSIKIRQGTLKESGYIPPTGNGTGSTKSPTGNTVLRFDKQGNLIKD